MSDKATRKTLAELNAAPHTYAWGGIYEITSVARIGMAGRGLGKEVHLLRVAIVTDSFGPVHRGNIQVGGYFSVHAACGTRSNGQHQGRVFSTGDTDQVTCERCLERFGWGKGAK